MIREIKQRICEFVHERNGSKALCKNQIESCLQLIRLCDVVRIMNQVESEYEPKTDWIPFEEKEADEDEKEAYGCEYMLCCKLPDEDEEILVTYANGNVGEDIFLRDGYECYLDSGAEFITEAIAWMPKPQPYKKEGAE